MSQKFDPENPFKTQQTTSDGANADQSSQRGGLIVEQFFSTADQHPFDQLEWENRSAKITDDSGQTIFEQEDIEVPASWSQLATKIVASKYFYGDIETGKREHSVKQLVHREIGRAHV